MRVNLRQVGNSTSEEDYAKFVAWQQRGIEFETKAKQRSVEVLGFVDVPRVKAALSRWFALNINPLEIKHC